MKAEEIKAKKFYCDFFNIDLGDMDEGDFKLMKCMQAYAEQEKRKAFPNTEADGVVFCGKCGTVI